MTTKHVLAGIAFLATLTVTLLALETIRLRGEIEKVDGHRTKTSRPWLWLSANIWPYVLKPEAEQALKPKDTFRECAPEQGKDYCPEMIVVPAGSFMMGSTDKDAYPNEFPQHPITIAKPFAVAKFELTFDEWDTCVAYGDCNPHINDAGWGRGQRPVINVTWDEAQQYVAWLSKMTFKPYRLLTEAEYEYATRGGTQTIYPWGDEIGKNNGSCNLCFSQWDNKQTPPVGSFAANEFGLYDMVGNVYQWVEDCYHGNYDLVIANNSSSAWTTGDCSRRGARGGSWFNWPVFVRSANRVTFSTDLRSAVLGFRVARTLSPGSVSDVSAHWTERAD
jgi:formylglycine-generating enzyme required for sulfatase activity